MSHEVNDQIIQNLIDQLEDTTNLQQQAVLEAAIQIIEGNPNARLLPRAIREQAESICSL